MKLKTNTTSQGLPHLAWREVYKVWGGFDQMVGIALVGGIVGAAVALDRRPTDMAARYVPEMHETLFAGFVVGAVLGMIGLFCAWCQALSENRKPYDPSVRWRWRSARVERDATGVLWFVVTKEAGILPWRRRREWLRAPWSDITTFELATSSSWFTAAGEKAEDDSFVILTEPRGRPMGLIADHAGTRKQMADLHYLLTAMFSVEAQRAAFSVKPAVIVTTTIIASAPEQL